MSSLDCLSGMPQMFRAFQGWFSNIKIIVIEQFVDTDGLVQSIERGSCFQGTIQPLDPEKIKLKPEGQQSWQWVQIHCLAGTLNLKTNDRIIHNGIKYKVMGIFDYSLNNYIEYHVIQDYENE
jgi:hypothetical protein